MRNIEVREYTIVDVTGVSGRRTICKGNRKLAACGFREKFPGYVYDHDANIIVDVDIRISDKAKRARGVYNASAKTYSTYAFRLQ